MGKPRHLVITADDYGIGPATSQGILQLAARGRISAALLLVNCPDAERAAMAWRAAGVTADLGWHPCLTLDRPVLPARRVPSLVGPDGCFRPLPAFLRLLYLGGLQPDELEAELRAQYRRFRELTGRRPAVVAAHHHLHVFAPVGSALRRVLSRQRPLPYVRRVREPWRTLMRVPGARGKRAFLALVGGDAYRHWGQFPGNDWLASAPTAGVGPRRLARWLRRSPEAVVELLCHPGFLDRTLLGRDGAADEADLQGRVREWHLLDQPDLADACGRAGLLLTTPAELAGHGPRRLAHAVA